MATWNQPVISILEDHDYTVTLKVTGQYNAACTNSNITLLQANTVKFANSSKLCVLDVMSIQFNVGTSNGIISVEYANVDPNNNTTVWTTRGDSYGAVFGLSPNPVEANNTAVVTNAIGDLNLALWNIGANDVFDLLLTVRKSDYNGAFANVGLAYDSPWHGP